MDRKKKEPATELMKMVAKKTPQRRKILKDFSPEEAKEILRDVYGSGKSEKSTEGKELRRKQRELIYNVKITAKKMEVGNKSKIIVFPSYSKKSEELRWYKMGDFSAQYFAYRMADRMGRPSPRLRDDKDRFGKMHVIVSISDIDKFVSQAMKLNEFDRHEVTEDKIHILYLKKGLTDDEVALLRRTEEMRKEMMHNVLRPKKAVPEMFLTILTLARQVTKMTNGMDRIYRIEIGDKITGDIVELLSVYYDYVGGFLNSEETKEKIQKQLFRVRAGMVILGDNEIIQPMKACAIGETVAKIEELIKEIK